jgi:nickel-dependent lactate racemase
MKVELHYGKGFVSLQIPENNIEEIIRPWQDEAKADNMAIIRQAMTDKQAHNFQKEIAGKRLCVLTEDGTRDVPLDDILGPVFSVLKGSALVRFLVCTGTHDAGTAENNRIKKQIENAAGKAGVANLQIYVHDCQQDAFVKAGRTSRGTLVSFNAKADDVGVFLVLSDMKCHYFAGYSNPIKNFVPGICAYETAEQNHSLAIDDKSTFGIHPWHADVSRRNNPVAQDQLEGMRLIVKNRPVYALDSVSTSGKIQWAGFGHVENVTAEAFDKIDERNTHTVRPVDRLIVSPGGLPNDVSLYIAQRALELTRNAVTDNGEVLFLAACPDGVGEKRTIENFYNLLTAPIDHILKSTETEYKLYSHKSYKFARLIQRLRKIWMYSQIPDDLIQAAHLHPTNQPQTVIDNWLTEDADTKITIVDGANKIALYSET